MHLEQVSAQQNIITPINEILDALVPAALFGIDWTSVSGLTFAYYGGILHVDGTATTIASGTASLTASSTNYVERTAAGTVSVNVSGVFSPDKIPLYTIVTSSTGFSLDDVTDYRQISRRSWGMVTISLAGSPNSYTLSNAEAQASVLKFSGVMTSNATVIVPAIVREWTVINTCTGGSPTDLSVTVKTASGTGVAVPNVTSTVSVYKLVCDGTNVLRIT